MKTNVISFSGGKDSSAMVIEMLERNEPIHSIVFVDTGFEFPQVYEHINKFEKYIGIKIEKLEFSTPFEYMMCERIISRGKHKGQKGYGWPRSNARYCTTYKTQALDKYKRSLNGLLFNECVGIASDEPKRIRDKRYPLVEYGLTESDCLKICYKHGFDYDGLYDRFSRLSCYICPLKRISEYEIIYKEFPNLWAKMRELDNQCINDFRLDYTLDELERKFNE